MGIREFVFITELNKDPIIHKDNPLVKTYKIEDKDVDDIAEGNECGIKFVTDEVIQEGDTLVAYKEEEKHRKIT